MVLLKDPFTKELNYKEMTGSFSYNSSIKFHGEIALEPQNDHAVLLRDCLGMIRMNSVIRVSEFCKYV